METGDETEDWLIESVDWLAPCDMLTVDEGIIELKPEATDEMVSLTAGKVLRQPEPLGVIVYPVPQVQLHVLPTHCGTAFEGAEQTILIPPQF